MGTGVTLSVRSPETCETNEQGVGPDHPGCASRSHPSSRGGVEVVDNSILMGKFERVIKLVMISL